MTAVLLRGFLENFPLWMLIVGLFTGIVAARRVRPAEAPAALARETIFWSIGITGLWGFIFHVFFARYASAAIGWQHNGFETEVGLANLAFGFLGIVQRFRTLDFSWAVVLGTSIFLLGTAINHVVGIVDLRNYAPGNAGTVLWTDVLVPVITLILTARARRREAGRWPMA